MAENLRIARLYLVLLAIFAAARFAQGAMGVEYAKAHHVFSIVMLTLMASIFYAAFCRRWRGFGVLRAMGLGLTFGLMAELVIFLATMISYALGLDTFFNNPTALNQAAAVPLAQAVVIRARGLVTLPVVTAVMGAIGWALGGLLPDAAAVRVSPAMPATPRVVL